MPIVTVRSEYQTKIVDCAPPNWTEGSTFKDACPKTTTAPERAKFLSPEIPPDNSNVFFNMLRAAGM